jgi:hypothetical protein
MGQLMYVKALRTHREYDRKGVDEMGMTATANIDQKKYGKLTGKDAAEGDRIG